MYSFGDVVLIKFPFTDLETSKKRPGFVLAKIDLSSKMQLLIVAMVTSKLDVLKLKGDVRLKSWQEVGLLHPSVVRLSKIATLETDIIERKIGSVAQDDLKKIYANFKIVFKELLSR